MVNLKAAGRNELEIVTKNLPCDVSEWTFILLIEKLLNGFNLSSFDGLSYRNKHFKCSGQMAKRPSMKYKVNLSAF